MYPLINPIESFGQGLNVIPNYLNTMQQMQQAKSNNQLNQMLMPYAQPEAEARLNLLNAQSRRENALANTPLMRNEKVIATDRGYYAYDLATGRTRPISDPSGNPLMSNKNGMQVTGTPDGGFSITTGGMQVNPLNQQTGGIVPQGGQPLPVSAQQINRLQQLTGSPSNIQTMPSSPHSRYSNSGATLIDTNTGETVSVPVQGQTKKWQNSLAASEIISPSLKKIYSDIAPFVGTENLGNKLNGIMDQISGNANSGYSAYSSALKTQIPLIADSLLGDLGLNSTTQNREAIQKALDPSELSSHSIPDTRASYARRIADTLSGVALRDKTYTRFLKGGISLSDKDRSDPSLLQELSNKYYWELRKSSSPSRTINGKKYYQIDGNWHQD